MFDYSHAIVRTPATSVVSGLRADAGPDPDFAALLVEHQYYVAILRDLGLQVDILAADEAYPDSVFVEDAALVFPQGAIILNLAAPTRAGEAALITPDLESRFERVLSMRGPGHADGGDILVLSDRVLIGLSGRTDREGAEELIRLLAQFDRKAEIAETPSGVLHFKTGCSLIDDETILALPHMAQLRAFTGLRVVEVPRGEERAANMLRIRHAALIGANFPRSRDLIEKCGIPTIEMPVEQIGRIDAGLSCMSLRWHNKA